MRAFKTEVSLLSVVILVGLWGTSLGIAAEQPRYGGILRVALAGDPPSLDMHQEQTFMVTIPLSPCYNTLVQFSPHEYPKVVGDLADSWMVLDDHLTYSFTLHEGVQFHDGSELTAADVKASWDKIVFPPEGVASPRKSYYEAIKRIDAPDRDTVVFHLHYPSASFLTMLAHPANFIYAKKYLDRDVNYYKQHVMGTGPFKLKRYVRGSYLEVERNPNYFRKGLPYLDGSKYFIIQDTSARATSIRSGRTDVEFRSLPPAEAEAIKSQLGDQIVVAHPLPVVQWGVAINLEKKPLDDARVRKALTLAIDRYEMAKTIGQLSGLDMVGGLEPPGTPWALGPEALQELPGFRKDPEANLRKAKRLLAEAGYPNGFKVVLTNRAVKLPYIDFAVFLIDAWKKIGIEVEHQLEASATWSKSRLSRDFELLVDPFGSSTVADPDEVMVKFTTSGSNNWGRFSDPQADKLFVEQKTTLDPEKRSELVKEMQKVILQNAWWIPGLWWTRLEVRSARIRNYEPMPSHWQNRRLEDVWLAAK